MISKSIKLLLIGALFSTSAEALVVLQQASSSFDTQYDTNPFLREEKQSIWRYTITPRYSIAAVEDQNRWFVNAGLALQRNSDTRIIRNRQDPNLDLGWNRELERGQFSILAHYDKRSSRFSEFNRNGLVDIDGSAITKYISSNWSRALTERLNYSLGAQYTSTTYASSQFSDSITKNINSSLTYEYNERVSPFVQIGYTDFKSDGVITGNGLLINNGNGSLVNNSFSNAQDSKSKNISIGMTILLSPTWTFVSSVGFNKINSSNQNTNTLIGSASGSGKIANLSLAHSGERSNFRSVLSRSVAPSGIGGFIESDQFNTSYSYLLSEGSTFGISYNINKNKSNFNSESTQFTTSYSKELTDMWQMRFSFESRNQKNFDQDTNGNIVGLTFTYSTPEF